MLSVLSFRRLARQGPGPATDRRGRLRRIAFPDDRHGSRGEAGSRLRSSWPIFGILPSLGLSPVVCCGGRRPRLPAATPSAASRDRRSEPERSCEHRHPQTAACREPDPASENGLGVEALGTCQRV